MTPSLTVLIPTRNRAEFLVPTLTSVLAAGAEAQRVRGFRTEVLVVDDASDDDGATRAVAERHGVRYHRITEHDGRRDPGVAIAAGVQLVETTHHLLFGDDDAMLPMHVTRALGHVVDGADVVSTSYAMTDPELRVTREVVLREPHLGDLARGHSLVNDGAVVRTELVRDLTWDPSLIGLMLLPHWVRLMLDGRTFAVSTTPTWLYRRHDDNISTELSAAHEELRARLVTELQAQVVAELGALPDSPYEAYLAARRARRAKIDAEEAARTDPAALRARNRWDKRARRGVARWIAPARRLD